MAGVHLLYDGIIANAIRRGDNDEAYEYSVLQRQYYESYCDHRSPAQVEEWKRREKEQAKW